MKNHATSEIAIGSKLGIDARKKLPGGQQCYLDPFAPSLFTVRYSAPEDHQPARPVLQNRVVACVGHPERWNKDSTFRPNRIN